MYGVQTTIDPNFVHHLIPIETHNPTSYNYESTHPAMMLGQLNSPRAPSQFGCIRGRTLFGCYNFVSHVSYDFLFCSFD